MFDVSLCIPDLATDRVEIVLMRCTKAFEAGDVGFEPCFFHQAFVTGRDRLGHGELVGLAFTEVLKPPNRGITGEGGSDKAGLALIVLHMDASSEPCVA